VVYGVLLRPLSYHNPQQIVRLWEQNATGDRINFADPNFDDVRAQNRSLSGIAVFDGGLSTVTGHGDAARVQATSVTRDFFDVMGVQPIFGRAFSPEEQRLNASPAGLISYAYWQQTLGGMRDLSSIHLKLDNHPLSIIGVLPPGFRFLTTVTSGSPARFPRKRQAATPTMINSLVVSAMVSLSSKHVPTLPPSLSA